LAARFVGGELVLKHGAEAAYHVEVGDVAAEVEGLEAVAELPEGFAVSVAASLRGPRRRDGVDLLFVGGPDGGGDDEARLAREGAEVDAEARRELAVLEGVEVAARRASAALWGIGGGGGVVGHGVRVAGLAVRA